MASSRLRVPPCGKSDLWRFAQPRRELIFGPNVRPLPSGTSIRSRGIDSIVTVRPTGSSDTTINVSVSACDRLALRAAEDLLERRERIRAIQPGNAVRQRDQDYDDRQADDTDTPRPRR